MASLVLASASPRRRELLERVGLVLDIRPADVDETALPGEHPATYVARIARAKATAILRAPGEPVLAAATTVTIDGAILAKAGSPAEAEDMLAQLSGRTHQVLTAFAIAHDRGLEEHVVASDVTFVALDDALVADYIASGEWRGKAGAYAIQGIGAALVSHVRGSVTNVIGLPLAEVLASLRATGGPVAKFVAGTPS